MTARKASKWLVRPRPHEGVARLFCFPPAGNGASAYREWPALAGPLLEVCIVQPPGREGRLAEPPFSNLSPLLDAMMPALVPWLDRPFALFGHSLGALVAFGVARRLRDRGGPTPRRLIVSARSAPHLALRHPELHGLPDAELVDAIRKYAGTPEAVLAHRELMELLLPTLRADFRVHETYAHDDAAPLDVPIDAFGGTDDPGVDAEGLEAWRDHTRGSFSMRLFSGGHFYLHAHQRELVETVRKAVLG